MNHKFKKLLKIATDIENLGHMSKRAEVDLGPIEDTLAEIRSYGDDFMEQANAAIAALKQGGLKALDISELEDTLEFMDSTFTTLREKIADAR